MKKLLIVVAALAVFAGQMLANPVDVNTAKDLGVKYLKNNVVSAKNITDTQHVYTLSSENDTPYLYVFNYENGYVVVAADDRACPILGYGDGTFDVNNIPDGLKYFLGHYGRQIQYAIDNELVAEEDIVEQWELLRKEGITSRTRMEKAVSPLLATTWDQGWPYNYYAPACTSYWTNNHCYAGCVATAMSQVMKYWNWPETGVGEHSYSSSSYGGTLSANFGATTYNWSIMPNSLGSQATTAAQAVALLMYHCGIAVDMDYAPDGSGAQTGDVPTALSEYFRYGACANMKSRDNYTRSVWEDMLIETFDRGIPVVYAGYDTDGGHAFNCDGYNNNRYFHFNWGWSGSYNNYYQIDALNTGNGSFNTNQRAVFEIIPDYIYNAMVPAIESMNVNIDNAITRTANISWTVPSTSVSGEPLTAIQQIVLKRNGVAIQTYDNPQPGETLTFVDEVAEYGAYEYAIIGKNNGFEGEEFSQVAIFGPSCTWKFVCQTTNFQGWNDGKLQAVSANGTVLKELTMTSSSSPLSEKVRFPEGDFSLNWVAPATAVSSITITLKNSANQTVYTFTGASTQLNGTIFSGNNDCPNCTAPTDFTGEYNNGGVLLRWNCAYVPSKFKVYRSEDGIDYSEIANIDGEQNEYFDNVASGTYYYKVTAYSSSCESDPALTNDDEDNVMVTVPYSVTENSVNAKLYPNPTTGNLRIEGQDLNTVAVFNLVGQKVYEETVNSDECVINMKEFGSGIYMVRIQTMTGSTTQKVSVIE